nr:MAG TPA_asm: hypothetical protein [Caudoviricetes sp.]
MSRSPQRKPLVARPGWKMKPRRNGSVWAKRWSRWVC